jgi:integration host factor subunit beta
VNIPEKRVPHFKPGKALRAAVDQRTEEMALLCSGRDAK